eukprot:6191792-Pleurochrysis_carterae.AAC.1
MGWGRGEEFQRECRGDFVGTRVVANVEASVRMNISDLDHKEVGGYSRRHCQKSTKFDCLAALRVRAKDRAEESVRQKLVRCKRNDRACARPCMLTSFRPALRDRWK